MISSDLVSTILFSCLAFTLCVRVYLAFPESRHRIHANWGAKEVPTPLLERFLQVILSLWKVPGPVLRSDWKPLRLEYENVRVIPGLLARMERFRGDKPKGKETTGDLPFLYFHAFAFPAVMEITLRREFPASALGGVMVESAVTSWIPFRADEEFHVRGITQVSWDRIRPHHRGFLVDIVASVRPMHHVRTAWQNRMTLLCFGVPTCSREASPSFILPHDTPANHEISFSMEATAGRAFAAINGDMNPIHMSDWSAKLMGFPRALAHGMGIADRIIKPLIAAANDDAVRAEDARGCVGASRAHFVLAFRKPVWLPSKPTLRLWTGEENTAETCKDAGRAWAQELIGSRGSDADQFTSRGVEFEVHNCDSVCQTGSFVLAKADVPLF